MYTLKALTDFVRKEGTAPDLFRHIEYVIDMAFTDSESQGDFDWFYGAGPEPTGFDNYDLLIQLTLLYKAWKYGKFLDPYEMKKGIAPRVEETFPLFMGVDLSETYWKDWDKRQTPEIFSSLNIFAAERNFNNV